MHFLSSYVCITTDAKDEAREYNFPFGINMIVG